MFEVNKEFVAERTNLKHVHIAIMQYLLQWVASSKCPKLKQFSDENNGLWYFYIYLNKIAEDLFLSRIIVQRALFRLENRVENGQKKYKEGTEPFLFPKQVKRENRLYIAINPRILTSFLKDAGTAQFLQKKLRMEIDVTERYKPYAQKLLKGNAYNVTKIKAGDDMLFDVNESLKYKRKGYTKEAEMIARRMVARSTYFKHRLPADGERPTKTFIDICSKIQALYEGTFLDERCGYQLSDKCVKSKWFDTDGWWEKIRAVKGDWLKVKRLLFTALDNFVLMHEPEYMPFKKETLQKNLNLWLYDIFSNPGEGNSQFVQCINPPKKKVNQLSENKADRIFESLPSKVQDAGNRCVTLCPKHSCSGYFWQNIKNMAEWADTALKYEPNIHFWIVGAGDMIMQFYDYCVNNNINCTSYTFDIERAVATNSPWCWFVALHCRENGLNEGLSLCTNADDIERLYKGKIAFER